jgi:hypothetical protein
MTEIMLVLQAPKQARPQKKPLTQKPGVTGSHTSHERQLSVQVGGTPTEIKSWNCPSEAILPQIDAKTIGPIALNHMNAIGRICESSK